MGAIFAPGRAPRLTFHAACLTFCDMALNHAPPAPAEGAIPVKQAAPQTGGFLLVPGFPLMSYAAAIEPLRAANLLSGRELYRWWHAAPGGKPVLASNGVAGTPDCGTNTERAADTVLVCAGGNPALFDDRSVFAWLRRLARKGAVLGGVSGGPHLPPPARPSPAARSCRPCSRSTATASPARAAFRRST